MYWWRTSVGGLDLRGPRDDAHVGDAAFVAGPALPVRERRVERPRPARVVVVVRRGGAELVDVRQRPLDGRGQAVEELPLVERAVRATLGTCTVVGHRDDQRVVELAGLLEVVDHSPETVVVVGDVAGEHLGHPGEESLLVVVQRLPGPHRVDERPRLAVGTGAVRFAVRVDRRELGVGRQQTELLLTLRGCRRGSLRSPRRTRPCSGRPTRAERGAARARPAARST